MQKARAAYTYISLYRSVFEDDSERPLIDILSSTQISDPEEALHRPRKLRSRRRQHRAFAEQI
jgi:hypothetical protein